MTRKGNFPALNILASDWLNLKHLSNEGAQNKRSNAMECSHQWTTNDEKNKQALSTLSVFFRLKKKDRQQQKEERIREEDR